MKNWWYYHKWYVILGTIGFGIVVYLIGNALGFFTKSPDLQIAYVGKTRLPQDTVTALQQAFTSLAGDFNQDGEVIIQINQYIDDGTLTVAEAFYAEVPLIGDIANCDSYFFLTDDPQDLQRKYQIYACPDGGTPEDTDYSIEGKVIRFSDCKVLTEMDLGSYSETNLWQTADGSNAELLSGLFFGRRCFYTDDVTDNLQECSDLWDLLYNSQENKKD